MATRTTLYRPDTCPGFPSAGCEIEYSWDDSVPADARTHTVARVVRTCPAHAAAPFAVGKAAEDDTQAPRRENKRKNEVFAELLSRLTGDAAYTTTDSEGTIVFRGGIVTWAFDAQRVLQIAFTPSLTGSKRNQLQAAIDQRFGAGLIRVT